MSVCPWFRMKNSKGGLYWHVLHYHSAERHFACRGTKKLRAIVSMLQCELYRGRRQADYLRRSAVLIRSSVGEMSCLHRLSVDKEFRLVLSGSGPCFIGKEISTGTLAVRRVGNMFHDGVRGCFASTPVAARKQNHLISESFSVRCSASWLRVGPDDMACSGGRLAQSRRHGLATRVDRHCSLC